MAQQAESVALPKRLPLVIEPSNRDDTADKDAKLINGYMEVKDQEVWIYPRFGTVEDSRPPAGAATGRGIFQWRGDIYSIFNGDLYRNGVDVGNVSNAGQYRFDSCLGGTPKLLLGNGTNAYTYDTGAGLVAISDPQFPSSFVLGWAYLNGTTYVGRSTDGGLQGDDINDPQNWDSLNVIIAQIEPDINKAVAKQLVYVVVLKQWSGEVFYDAGNATGSPLGRVEGSKFNWGCLDANSVQQMDGALIWLGSSRDGSPEVILLNNLKAEAVSTKPVERLLRDADLTTVRSWTAKINGHRFYILTLVDADLSLVFDFDERRWTQWAGASEAYMPIVSSTVNSSNEILLQHETDGRIYKADPTLSTDGGTPFQVDIYTPNFDGGVDRGKQVGMMKLITDQKAGAFMNVRQNDHDYDPKKWTNFRQMDLSQKSPYLTDMGTFVRRAHNFRYKSAIVMPRIKAVELQIDLCTL